MFKNTSVRGFVCAAAGALFWGFSGTCCQYLFAHYEINALWLTMIRLLGGGVVLLLLEAFRHHKTVLRLLTSGKSLFQVFCIGILGFLYCQYAYLAAIEFLDAGTATVLQSLSIVMILIYTCFRFKMLPKITQFASILAAFLGVFLIVTCGDFSAIHISGAGIFWGLGSALGATLYSLLSPPATLKWGSPLVSGMGMLLGGIVLALCSGAYKKTPVLDEKAFLLLAVVILIGTVGGFTLFLQGVSDIGANRAALLGCLEPVAATISASVWLHSSFGAVKLLGFFCILAAIFLANLPSLISKSA